MKQQFDLSLWLQDKSRKVVTRDGRLVRIICTDRKARSGNIVGLVGEDESFIYVWQNDGTHAVSGIDVNNLFFADEEEELTEFEGGLFSLVSEFWQKYALLEEEVDIAELVKENSKELLDLARKELEPEFDKKLKEAYNQGGLDTQEEITKCLPKWKKDCFHNIISVVDGRLFYNGYYIDINELEKLPKEE